MAIHSVSKAAHEALAGGGTALIGVSMRNAYFNPLNIFELTQWASTRFSRVIYICPDEPSVNILLALGYDEEEARRKARTQFNYLATKCDEAAQKLGLKERAEVLRWTKLTGSEAYIRSLSNLKRLLADSKEFNQALRQETGRMIGSKREGTLNAPAADIGMKSLLEEYALIVKAQEILGTNTPCAYIYNRTTPVLDGLLDGELGYHGIAPDKVGTLVCEVVWPEHSVVTLPKTWSRKAANAGPVQHHG
jgi:tRNA-dependent cyclodipeptide synthase